MRKRIFITCVLLIVLMCNTSQVIFAKTRNVSVTLPNFKVTLNGIIVENTYREYPLIVYNDITYFPMTYNDCRFLGLETNWDNNKGLEISNTGISTPYKDYKSKNKNANNMLASIPSFNIKVNGIVINNSQEKYPLLTFRDVTYFPMTWKYAVEEFGWKYQFDAKSGLIIQSANPIVERLILKGYIEGNVVADNKYYYYKGANGSIYQAPIGQENNPKKIYQLPIWSYVDDNTYVNGSIYNKDGEIFLTYHQGGAVMGHDQYIRLNQDGTYEEVESGYLSFKRFGDITIKVNQGFPPSPNNLYIKYKGSDYRQIGETPYLYGWVWEVNNTSSGGSTSDCMYLVDNDIYLLAFNEEKDTDYDRIHKVNIDTNETIRVSDIKTNRFYIEDNNIYCISESNVYKITLDGKEEKLITGALDFKVLNNNIYYISNMDQALYINNPTNPINQGAKLSSLVQEDEYLICTFSDNSSHYKIIIFDKLGNIIYKSYDVVKDISINNGVIIYCDNKDNSLYKINIK